MKYHNPMKKRYFFLLLSIITTIAYLDMVDSCRQIDKAIAAVFSVDESYKTQLPMTKNPYFKMEFNTD